MNYESISVARDADVLRLTLARPERLNALTPAMTDEIRHALAHLDGARAVLLAGEGKGFCSGADLAAIMARGGDPGEGAYSAVRDHYNPLIEDIGRLPVPIVSAVRGAAAGLGCSIALSCDFCLASEQSYFLQAFVNIGLVPDGGASWLLPRLAGRARAAEMLLLGEKIPAARAADWGLIYRCVADDALENEAGALAQRLAKGPTLALGATRRLIFDGLQCDLGPSLGAEAEAQRDAAQTADSREGIGAFLTKRPPEFRGK
jgi:2-(1,2-epoxy-1,2-dihydrophenyl)acetyl-CoA isomerase